MSIQNQILYIVYQYNIMLDIMYHITDIITKAAVGITAVINFLSCRFLNFFNRNIIPQIHQHNLKTIYMLISD